MQITKEFLESEIADLETESQKARNFLIQSQATIQAYKMLINRLDAPELEQQNDDAI
jgi:septal ring factor EnvC (AmiA/AmiB activator)